MWRAMSKSGVDDGIEPFLKSLVSVLLKVLVVLSVAGAVGIEITAFAALLVDVGLAFGSAISGTLGQFTSRVMVFI